MILSDFLRVNVYIETGELPLLEVCKDFTDTFPLPNITPFALLKFMASLVRKGVVRMNWLSCFR